MVSKIWVTKDKLCLEAFTYAEKHVCVTQMFEDHLLFRSCWYTTMRKKRVPAHVVVSNEELSHRLLKAGFLRRSLCGRIFCEQCAGTFEPEKCNKLA